MQRHGNGRRVPTSTCVLKKLGGAERARSGSYPNYEFILGVSYYYARNTTGNRAKRKALEIDPNSRRPFLRLGLAFEQKRMYGDAIAEFRLAKDLSSGGSR